MCVLVEIGFCLPCENSEASGFHSFANSSDMEITASLSSDSALRAGFLLMRNGNKWVFRIKLKLGFAAEQNVPGEQPRGWGSSPWEGQMSLREWSKRRKNIWGLSEPFVGMGAALLPEHLIQKSDFVLPGLLVCSPVTWPYSLVERSGSVQIPLLNLNFQPF